MLCSTFIKRLLKLNIYYKKYKENLFLFQRFLNRKLYENIFNVKMFFLFNLLDIIFE